MAGFRSSLGAVQILLALILAACGTRPISGTPDQPGAPATLPGDLSRVVLIPGGPYEMGSDNFTDEEPAHRVITNAFRIDQTEVTNGQYARCVAQLVCQPPRRFNSYSRPEYYGSPQFADFPVIYVTWDDADTYCRWAGRRLPTEAEWERAARGTDDRIYPWGDQLPTPALLNYNFKFGDTSAVGSFPLGASPYGVLDLAGNVAEWVADWYAKDYYAASALSDPRGPLATPYRVVRGGSWLDNRNYVRAGLRRFYPPDSAFINLGFRCAESVPGPALMLFGPSNVTRH